MTESILDSVKTALDIPTNESDSEVLTQINHVFSTLNQMGVGPAEVFSISNNQPIWRDFLDCGPDAMSDLRTYLILTVKMSICPPAAPSLAACQEQINDSRWRLKMTTR